MTGTLKARVGTAWVPVAGSGQEAANTARWNTSWGRVGQVSVNNTTVPINPPQGAITPSLAVTLQSGRRYRIRCVIRAAGAGNKPYAFAVGLYDGGANTSLFDGWISGSANYGGGTVENIVDGDGLAHTYEV